MQRYLILIEPTTTGYSAYSPDIAGCVATASSREAIEEVMRDAVGFHLEGLRASGQPVPSPNTCASYVEVPV